MKKSIFILAALFAANFANAQITLEHTFNGYVKTLSHSTPNFENIYFIQENRADEKVTIYNTDFTLYKTANISIPEGYYFNSITFSLYNIFSPNKLGFMVWAIKSNDNDYNTRSWYGIFDEDGVLLKDLGYSSSISSSLCEINSTFYLLVTKYTTTGYDKTDVYSLPGNGKSGQGIASPSAPRKPARKILNNDQVYIENADHTYTLTGQKVR